MASSCFTLSVQHTDLSTLKAEPRAAMITTARKASIEVRALQLTDLQPSPLAKRRHLLAGISGRPETQGSWAGAGPAAALLGCRSAGKHAARQCHHAVVLAILEPAAQHQVFEGNQRSQHCTKGAHTLSESACYKCASRSPGWVLASAHGQRKHYVACVSRYFRAMRTPHRVSGTGIGKQDLELGFDQAASVT